MATCPHCNLDHGNNTDYCPRTGRPIFDVAKRMIGRTISGKFLLTKCIGQGGMGTIFEAEHALIGNRVAVKMLHEPFAASREPVQRLYREARATGAIGHPNIIHIHDVGETVDGIPFLVMELLDGESLGEYLERIGPLPLGLMLDISIQMLSALHAAHNAGIIHRDLKSDNIFLTWDEEDGSLLVKLLDFGVSKMMNPEQEALRLTQTGSILGTPYYMSPEQASGRKDLDYRIDLYSAGVIMYEMLTQRVPHTATNYNALLMQITSTDVESFAWRRTDLPPVIERAVLKALARDRKNRWRSALDFTRALEQIRDTLTDEQLLREFREKEKDPREAHQLNFDSEICWIPVGLESATPLVVAEEGFFDYKTAIRDRSSLKNTLAWIGLAIGLIAGLGVLYSGIHPFSTAGFHPDTQETKGTLAHAPQLAPTKVDTDTQLESDATEKVVESEHLFAEREATSSVREVLKKLPKPPRKKQTKREHSAEVKQKPEPEKQTEQKKLYTVDDEASIDRPMDNPF